MPLESNLLPKRIAMVMAGTIAVFVLTIAVAVLWMARALDREAGAHAAAQLGATLDNLLDQARVTTLDYGKWDDAAQRVAARDLPWLYDNVGLTATLGVTAQLVALWGGPLGAEMAWTDDGATAARADLLGPGVVAMAEAGLAAIPTGAFDGAAFFAWQGDALFAVAATRVEPPDASLRPPVPDAEMARLLMGTRIDDALIARKGQEILLDGLRLDRVAPRGRPSLPLLDGAGRPVAHLSWTPDRPGSERLVRMLPILLSVTTLAAGLVLLATALARRSARELVAAERTASAAARTDPLTGLPNRAAFGAALAPPAPAGERAVLVLDVNGFKRINDSLGQVAGDQVIRRLAERLSALTGSDCRLARIGGDEFAFLLAGANAGFRAEWLAHSAERAVAAAFSLGGHRLRLRAAVGYAVQAADGVPGEDLFRQADLAMGESKRHRGGAVAFGALIEQADRDARAIEVALRQALARPGELGLAYQPIVEATSGRMERAEALARWTSPELGPVPPDRFVAVAEQSGLIGELGRRLFSLICDDLAARPDLRVSVNVSSLQLMAPDFVPDLIEELGRRGIEPARVEIELTETVVVDDPRLAAERLGELHQAGFSTALDDFGTGFSSIGALKQMSFGTVKIDRSFVSGLAGCPERLALVNAMILLAHALRLRVVCEGVETAEELDLLRELGCDLAQGYHLDRPLPIERLVARWIERKAGPKAAVA